MQPLADECRARLEHKVPVLAGRVSGAASLDALMRGNHLPQATPAAHVIPFGMTAGRQTALTGMFRQEIERLIVVVLTIRTHDATGRRALEEIEVLSASIVEAIAGWTPHAETGVFALRRVALVKFAEGTFVQEYTFSLPDQLRITP